MCAIYGAFGPWQNIDQKIIGSIRELADLRGRDGKGEGRYDLEEGIQMILGNFRAAPTTEIQSAPPQPYNGLVHNGTIANDKELGGRDGIVDSQTLSQFLCRRSNIDVLREDLMKVKGSFALGIAGLSTGYIARNYKPLWYWSTRGVTYFASMPYMLQTRMPFGVAPVELEPYTILDLGNYDTRTIKRTYNKNRVVVVASAGLDSTTVAAHYASLGKEILLLHFVYGCKAQTQEVNRLRLIAESLEKKFATSCKIRLMHLPYSEIKTESPLLVAERDIASGIAGAEFAHEWVPARNLLMMSAAVALAEAEGYGIVSLGLNLEEGGAYPDNEEAFTYAMNKVMPYAVADGVKVEIECPLERKMKHEIVKYGLEIGAPFEHTWSCYKGGDVHCGECGPCFMRKTAFELNGEKDPVMSENAICKVPPKGWKCSREPGHEGPCAATPTES